MSARSRKLAAVVDACVFYSAVSRDAVLTLAENDLFVAKWTDAIHDEWTRNLLERRPDLSPAKVAKMRREMDDFFPFALVAGWESSVESFSLPDEDDRHVLAAAVKAGADYIITYNLKDFPATALKPHGVEAIHPDDFAMTLLRENLKDALEGLALQRGRLRKPSMSAAEFLDSLAAYGFPKTAAFLRDFQEDI